MPFPNTTFISRVTKITTGWLQAVNDFLRNLEDGTSGSRGAGLIPLDQTLAYTAGSVGFNLGKRKAVFATGVAATDDAAIQAAIDAAPVMGVIDLFGNFASAVAKNLKPQLMIRNGGGATITHSNVTANCFQYVPGGGIGFPGNIVIENIQFTGPGAPSGEALGTLTYSNVKAAVFIDANCPFVRLTGLDVRGFFAGAVLRRSYASLVQQGYYAVNRHGIMLFDESHATALVNVGCDQNTLTGASVNYGGNVTGTFHEILQDPTFVAGYFQNSPVGIWLERCQGAVGVGKTYFEGNTCCDILNGVNDGFAPGYERTANFTTWQGVGSASPCGTAVGAFQAANVVINHSVDVTFGSLGFYSGTPTTQPNVIVTGGCDRVEVDLDFTVSSGWINPGPNPERVITRRSGSTNYAIRSLGGLTYGVHGSASPTGRGPYLTDLSTPGGRPCVVLEALADSADVLLRAKQGQGQTRFVSSTGVELFSVDHINNRINCYAPVVFPVYTFGGTLPAPSASVPAGSRAFISNALAPVFGNAAAGGGAVTVPVYVDGAGTWRVG